MVKYSNKKNVIYLLTLPLVINNLFNILNGRFYFSFQNSSTKVELYNIILALFLFIFYTYFGKALKKIFKTQLISSAIIIFWLLVFCLENSFLFITHHVKFNIYIFVVFIFSLIYFFIKRIQINEILFIFLSFIVLKIVFFATISNFQDMNLNYEQLYTSDEKVLWFPAIESIFNKNYYSVLINNPFPGYGLLTAYIGAINSFLLLGFETFKYYLAINYLFIFLFILFLFEICKSKKTFIFLFISFVSVILSSHWFTYVFFGSLLSEVISSFCFGVLFTEIVSSKNKSSFNFVFLVVNFGFLFYSRQFISTLVILFVIFFAIKLKKLAVFLGLYAAVLKILQSLFLPNILIDPYINEKEFSQLLFNFSNVYKMLKQILIDKPLVYLLFIFVILILLNLKNQIKFIEFHLFQLLNFLFVVALMIFIWRKDDVQSSYRYLLNCFYLIIYPVSNALDDWFKKTDLMSQKT